MDERESYQTTNTSHLAPLVLATAQLHVRNRHDRSDITQQLNAPHLWMLYPGPEAETLAPPSDGHPVTLVVPDGTWRSTSRMIRRAPGLAPLPRVQLPPGPPARRWLRRPPNRQAVSTLEAIARAVAILEGDPQWEKELMRLLHTMIDRHLWSKGQIDADKVTGGIPEAALAHKG